MVELHSCFCFRPKLLGNDLLFVPLLENNPLFVTRLENYPLFVPGLENDPLFVPGLENDLVASATHHSNSFLFGEDDEERPYDSHVQRAEPRNTNLRKRLAECQKEIGKMQNTIAEYQVRSASEATQYLAVF